MAFVKYRLHTNNEWNTVYLRFKQGEKFDTEVATDIKVPKGRWSNKGKILPTPKLNVTQTNKKLKLLSDFVLSSYESAKLEGVIIDNQWTRKQINTFFNKESSDESQNRSIFFNEHVTHFIEEAQVKRTKKNTLRKPRTIAHYQTTLSKLLLFEKYRKKKLLIKEIDTTFYYNFIEYLESVHYLSQKTIGGYIDDIKLFCKSAKRKGYQIPNDYEDQFHSPDNETHDIYLNESEINKIFTHTFNEDYLDNARDWFIIGLWTGLRISDFLKLTKENIDNGFFEKTTEKTGFPVIIPIHPQVQSILDKRNGMFPRRISDQKFNDYIKRVCKKAGITEQVEGAKMCPQIIIDHNGEEKKIYRKVVGKYPKYKLVTSHCCRRSFATNLYGKLDTLTIMNITGHRTEKQFLDYIKITPKEHANKLKELWNKSYKPSLSS